MAAKNKAGWQEKYDVVGINPGIIVHPKLGEIDLNNSNIPMETLELLEAETCPFIKKKSIEN